jgi:hypothetical protein
MSRALVTDDWRKLSEAARKERDRRSLSTSLSGYGVVNEGHGKRGVSREAKLRRVK